MRLSSDKSGTVQTHRAYRKRVAQGGLVGNDLIRTRMKTLRNMPYIRTVFGLSFPTGKILGRVAVEHACVLTKG
jgi:hypothetical protein